MSIQPFALASRREPSDSALSPAIIRGIFTLLVGSAAVAGVLATDPGAAHDAAVQAGADLTRLLRFMALIKTAMAAAAVGAVLWRLGAPATPVRLAVYALSCGATVAGPGLIWQMAHVGLGALLLHGGLVATVVVLWRDPAVWHRMDEVLKRRTAPR